MRATLYLESSVPSYLVGRESRDLQVAAKQKLTREWWGTRRTEFALFVSTAVRDELGKGHPSLAAERLRIIEHLPILQESPAATGLSARLLRDGALPSTAAVDALHVAICAVHGIDYLVTWNCAHINNPFMRREIEDSCRAHGFRCPTICTPRELLAP